MYIFVRLRLYIIAQDVSVCTYWALKAAAAAIAIQRVWRGYCHRVRFAEYLESVVFVDMMGQRDGDGSPSASETESADGAVSPCPDHAAAGPPSDEPTDAAYPSLPSADGTHRSNAASVQGTVGSDGGRRTRPHKLRHRTSSELAHHILGLRVPNSSHTATTTATRSAHGTVHDSDRPGGTSPNRSGGLGTQQGLAVHSELE